jgi:uncharacterized protein
MIVSIIADTHIPKRAKDLPAGAYELIGRSDAVIHAGDILTNEFLKKLSNMVPVYAVLGNNDIGVTLPETLELELDGINIAVIHDAGPRNGRRNRMKMRFPNARIVVYGHSHIPECTDESGLLLFNPGSPTDRRRQPEHTMGLLKIAEGDFEASIVKLPKPKT